jgi:hypothetical protein
LKLNVLEIDGNRKANLFMSEFEAGDLKTPPKSKCSLQNLAVGACKLSKIDTMQSSICILGGEGLNYETSLRDLMIEGRFGGSPKKT